MREWAYNQGAAQVIVVDARRAAVAHAGGGRRARRSRPPGLRDGPVQPPPRSTWACSSGCPRRSAPGSASTTTPTAPSARRASRAASSRGCAPTCSPTCCPQLDGVEERLARRHRDRRRGLRRRRHGAAVRRGVPRVAGAWATTSRSTRSISRGERQAEAGVDQRRASSTRATTPLPDRRLRRLRHDVRLHPRHDGPASA